MVRLGPSSYILTQFRLGLRLELIGGSIVTLCCLFAVVQRNDVNAGFAALSIVYSLQLTQLLNWMVRSYTQAETDMVSVERIMKYSELNQEAPENIPDRTPPGKWSVQVQNLTFFRIMACERKSRVQERAITIQRRP
jgi:ABC-type multidrug transport system fused ATPase/permease subunit